MKKAILFLTIIFSLIMQGQSQNPAKKEKIKTLFVLIQQDSLIIRTVHGMTSTMAKSMSTIFNDTTYTNHGIDASKWTEKLVDKSMQKSIANALQLLNGEMVDIYDKYFTIEEIEDYTIFYKSRSGQKMLAQMPDITRDIMTLMTTKYQTDFQQSVMKDIEEMRNEMAKEIKAKQQ